MNTRTILPVSRLGRFMHRYLAKQGVALSVSVFAMLSFTAAANPQTHPSLLVDASEMNTLKQARGQVKAFDATVDRLIADAEQALREGINVPAPAGGGGSVAHEQHKTNYYAMFHCGLAYQYTGDKRYAKFVADMLTDYAKKYPGWGLHPLTLSALRGRLFWQTLNESVWLVHTSVAYDCIYNTLSKDQRRFIEKNLLENMADFIMNGCEGQRKNHEMFNHMHNHATWATAAVGMAGMAMNNETLVRKALYGSDETGKNGGFIRQMDWLFSPDGYYAEGAYYERYAIWPFVMFAQCIQHNKPELKIFEYRDSILKKAADALVQMSYEGEFMHFNDALQKGLSAQELVYAANILYHAYPDDKQLLGVSARYQKELLPIIGGYELARDRAAQGAPEIKYRSVSLSDGRLGDKGAFGIIRSTDTALNSAVTLKATSQGMGHGHFDKLTLAYYDNGHEILTDYGSARFLNIEAKYNGHYTKENTRFAKQTIAHNTLVVDERSHYNGKTAEGEKHHADMEYTNFGRNDMQWMTGRDTTAYPGVEMKRTVAYLTTPATDFPLIIDVLNVRSEQEHKYDYPMWFNGHEVSTNFAYTKATDTMTAFGKKNGYQYLWKEAWGTNDKSGMSQFTFFNDTRFYTLNTVTSAASELYMLRLGANDPDFNLRPSTAFLVREPAAKNHTFVTVIETHGYYDVLRETSKELKSRCKDVKIVRDDADSTVVEVVYGDSVLTFTVDHKDASKDTYKLK